MKHSIADNKGFSLVELIIVIAIMAVLAGALTPALVRYIEKSRESTDLQNIATIRRVMDDVMSEQEVYDDVIDKITGDKIIIDLGETKNASFDNAGLDNYSKLRKKLKETIASDVSIKSSEALATGNHLLVEVTSDGNITVYIANGSSTDSTGAIQCRHTTNVDGSKALFLICK